MATDTFKNNRQKRRFICEVRYEPLVSAFDKRGTMLDVLQERFKDQMSHWAVENVAIMLSTSDTSQLRSIRVDHLRAWIAYEDAKDEAEFQSASNSFLDAIINVHPKAFGSIRRFGFRTVTLATADAIRSFDDARSRILDTYFASPLPSTLALTDCKATLTHEHGQISVGPFKKGEPWLNHNFVALESVPDFGFAVDIDTRALDLKCSNAGDVQRAFSRLADAGLATENETLASLLKQ